MFLAVLSNSYREEKINDECRIYLKLPPVLAPVKIAVLPLTKKDGLPSKAKEIMGELKLYYNCQYEEKDSIGKRYRRQDAIGTPFCITVDHESLKNNTVTLRDRDTMEQKRITLADAKKIISEKVDYNEFL